MSDEAHRLVTRPLLDGSLPWFLTLLSTTGLIVSSRLRLPAVFVWLIALAGIIGLVPLLPTLVFAC